MTQLNHVLVGYQLKLIKIYMEVVFMMYFRELALSEKIKYLRNEKGLSQGALSRKANVSVAEICRLESGERSNPSVTLLNKLLVALEVSNNVYIEVTGFTSLR